MCIWQLHVVDQLEHVETTLLQCTPKKYLCAISIHIQFLWDFLQTSQQGLLAVMGFAPISAKTLALEHEERASAALVADASNSKAVR